MSSSLLLLCCRVLRPPGGGSSDIFGSEMPQTPRNVKNRMVSNIFAAEKDNGVKNNGKLAGRDPI